MKVLHFLLAWILASVVVSGCDTSRPGEGPLQGEIGPLEEPQGESVEHFPDRVSEEPPAPSPLSESGIQAALKKANPHMTEEAGMAGDGRVILAVESHDRNLKDISPLGGLPLMALDLARTGVENLEPLRGMPLRELYLEETSIDDTSPLEGMPLEKLYLSNTKADDLSPLARAAQLKELNLVETKVSDLSPLAGLPQLEMLWLTGCPVENIQPLARVRSLVSLTLEKTKVEDLSPLEGHPLLRLHIGDTPVTDLTPLRSMQLTRLIFTPNRIEKGMEHARNMRTLREIDVEFSDPRVQAPMAPAEFWAKYDAGKL